MLPGPHPQPREIDCCRRVLSTCVHVLQGLGQEFISRLAREFEPIPAWRLRMVHSSEKSAISKISRKKTARVHCPICGPYRTSPVGVSNGLPIVTCQGCNLMYVSECPSLDDTLELFREEHMKDSRSTQVAYVDYRKKSLEREAVRIRGLMPQGGRLLDVGTASGFFLSQFHGRRDWQVEGVEPSRVSAQFARQQFGLRVHEGFLSEQAFCGSSFDVVCSLDAFGCHRQPQEDMQEFSRILKPGGLLAIEIPGHRFRMMTGSGLLYRAFTGRSLRLNAGVNFFYFTRSTLTQLAAMAGLEFKESHPESMPASGNRWTQFARNTFDRVSGALYRATHGRLNFCAKELCIFQKPHPQCHSGSFSTTSDLQNLTLRAG